MNERPPLSNAMAAFVIFLIAVTTTLVMWLDLWLYQLDANRFALLIVGITIGAAFVLPTLGAVLVESPRPKTYLERAHGVAPSQPSVVWTRAESERAAASMKIIDELLDEQKKKNKSRKNRR